MKSARRGLHGAIVEALGRRIVHGTLPTGTQFTAEELGEEFDASRTVIRETMRVLESKGLIVARQNIGTRVLEPSSWSDLDADILRWRLDGDEAEQARRELVELRGAIEPAVARLAAVRMTAEQRSALSDAAVQMQRAFTQGNVEDFTSADIAFHRTLFAGSESRMLTALVALVNTALDDRKQSVTDHGISEEAVNLHAQIADAVATGDAATAVETMHNLLAASYPEHH